MIEGGTVIYCTSDSEAAILMKTGELQQQYR